MSNEASLGHFLVLARVLRFQGENVKPASAPRSLGGAREERGAGRTKGNFISNEASLDSHVFLRFGFHQIRMSLATDLVRFVFLKPRL